MKLFKIKEEKNKVGRPKLADDKTKKKAIIMCITTFLLIIILLGGCLVNFNMTLKFKKLKGYANLALCSEIPSRFQPRSESNTEGLYDYGFTDPKFYSAVVSTYNRDSSYCTSITEEQLKSVTDISSDSNSINSLDGIQYLTNLQSFSLGLTSYSPGNLSSIIDLSHNTALTRFSLSNYNISDIDVSHNTALTSLGLSKNKINNIDLSKNTALTSLYLNSNDISNIDLSHNTGLTYLNLNENKINNLNLENNKALTDLYLSDNNLTNIDLASNTALNDLRLDGNKLNSIDLSNNTDLTHLNLNSNEFNKEYSSLNKTIVIDQPKVVTAYPSDTTYAINAAWNYRDVAIYNNGIVERLKPGETNLQITYKVSNSVDYQINYHIVFMGVTNTSYQVDYENKTIDLNKEVISNLRSWNFSYVPSTYNLNINNDKLEVKDADGSVVDTYTFTNYVLYKLTSNYYTINEEEKTIDLNKELLNSLDVGRFLTNKPDCPSDYTLNINNDKLEIKDKDGKVVETYKFVNYSKYKLGGSYYTIDDNNKTIDAKGEIFKKDKVWINPSNQYELRVNENRLEILDSNKNVVDSYEIINAKTNDEEAYLKAGFKDKNLYTCVVREFTRDEDIEGNYLLTDEEMDDINELYCINQSVSDATGIEKLTNLRGLDLSYNNIQNIDLSKNKNLSELIIVNNKLTNMDVTNNVSLQTIAIANNKVSKIVGLDKLEGLGYLIVYNNNLLNLDISKNTNLGALMVSNNPLANTLYMLKGKEIDYKKDFKLNEAYDIKYDVVDKSVVSYKDNKLKALKEGITNIYLSNENIMNATTDFYDKSFKCQYLQDEKACSEIENINEEEALLSYLINQEIKVYDIISKEYTIDKDKKIIDALNKDFDASLINITLNGLTGILENDKFIIKDKDVVVDTYTVTNIKKVIKEEVVSDSSNGTKVKPSDKVIEKIEERKEKAEEKLEDIIVETDKVPFSTLLLVKGKDRNIIVKSNGITITINGRDIDKVTGNLDLSYELKVLKESTIYEEVKDKFKNGMVLRFKDNSTLPYKILVELNVTDNIEKNMGIKDINIYNYDNAKYNLVAEKLLVNNNKLTFYVNKLGNYILTSNEVKDKYVKSDSSMITENTKLKNKITHKGLIILFVIFIILIILGVIGYITYKNKEQKN